MISGNSLADVVRFQQIDPSNIADHFHLEVGDICIYLREYTSGQGYGFSDTNGLISNLKKKVSRKGLQEYRYKIRSIERCSEMLSKSFNPDWLNGATLIPVPPSKAKDDPEYDDRMLSVCQQINTEFPLDIREIVIQRKTIRAAHESEGNRPTIDELIEIYEIDEAKTVPFPQRIAIVDDVLTAGTHFKAMQRVLSIRFPGVQIVGVFIARRVLPNCNPADDFDFL